MADPKSTTPAAASAAPAATAKKPTPTDRLIEAHQSHVDDLDRQLGERGQTIKTLSAERDNLARQVANVGAANAKKRRGNGWIPWTIFILIVSVLAFVLGLRAQNDCFGWNNFWRWQDICFVSEGASPTVDSTIGDDEAIKPSSSDEGEGGVGSDESATIIPVSGDGKPPVVTPKLIVPETDDDPCVVVLIGDLKEYFEYRDWDSSHIAVIKKALAAYDPAEATPPIDYREYAFWGDDGPNLRAFIRDQRFGEVEDGMVIEVTKSTATTRIRYTVFRCECGITAIYREVKTVVIKKPPPKYVPPTPSDDIPDAWCVDPRTRVKKTCV